jgi:hypothetical protein
MLQQPPQLPVVPHPTLPGVLGDRLKVKVAAPASEGQVNAVVIALAVWGL